MKRILRYLNPITHFGDTHYSPILPFIATLLTAVLVEAYVNTIVKNPEAVGLLAIFLFIPLIIYFSFREGIRGGFTSTFVTISYYFYIIYSQHYQGAQFSSGIQTTIVLGLLYFFLAWVIGLLKQTIDILIEREANEKRRLRTILQELPVGVVITDENGKLVLGNKQLEKILGRKVRDDAVVGKDTIVDAYYRGKPITPTQWPLAQTLATGKSVQGKEILLGKKTGKKRYVEVSATLIHNKRGKVIAAASIFNDITQQKELEDRKDDFVNMASHELKTPITSMKLYIDTLQKRIKPLKNKDMTKIVAAIGNQTDRLQNLVNDMLDVSRLQTGRLAFTSETFDISQVISQTITELKSVTQSHAVVYSQKTSIIVNADKFRIYQVLTNLLTNAAKYSDDGTKIIIKAQKEQKQVIVSVKDQGMGIAKEQQKRVFDRLYQISDSKEKSFPGLGMGLYIVKQIIKKHHGDIWVESIEGKGSTFYFSLPL